MGRTGAPAPCVGPSAFALVGRTGVPALCVGPSAFFLLSSLVTRDPPECLQHSPVKVTVAHSRPRNWLAVQLQLRVFDDSTWTSIPGSSAGTSSRPPALSAINGIRPAK